MGCMLRLHLRRVSDAIVGIDPASSYGQAILAQEKLKGQFTMDLRGGYSLFMNKMFRFKAKQRFYLQINWTISNLTNNKDFILYGNEQVRYDFRDQNTTSLLPSTNMLEVSVISYRLISECNSFKISHLYTLYLS